MYIFGNVRHQKLSGSSMGVEITIKSVPPSLHNAKGLELTNSPTFLLQDLPNGKVFIYNPEHFSVFTAYRLLYIIYLNRIST